MAKYRICVLHRRTSKIEVGGLITSRTCDEMESMIADFSKVNSTNFWFIWVVEVKD